MAAMAWGDVSKVTLQRCWRKLWPGAMFQDDSDDEGNEFEGFGDKRLSEIRKMLKTVKGAPKSDVLSKLTDNEIVEWMDENPPVVEEQTDEQIMLSVTNPDALEAKEEDSDGEEEEKEKISWKEADKGLATFVKFAEGSSHYSAVDVMNFHLIYREFQAHRSSSLKQMTLTHLFKKAAKKASSSGTTSRSETTSPEPWSSAPEDDRQVDDPDPVVGPSSDEGPF